jgi:hypothetical protein
VSKKLWKMGISRTEEIIAVAKGTPVGRQRSEEDLTCARANRAARMEILRQRRAQGGVSP